MTLHIGTTYKNSAGTSATIESIRGDTVYFVAKDSVSGSLLNQRACAKVSDFLRRFPIKDKKG